MKRIISLAATAVAAAGLVAIAAPANAANYDGSCGPGEFCVYADQNFNGHWADFSGDVYNYGDWNYWDAYVNLNDSVTAVKNRGTWYDVTSYQDANHSGGWLDTLSGDSRSNVGASYNDSFSSHKWW
ncbi:peptidase inhibitor family I36 protein [Kitasatospora phosalacinea]|uniref:peptidase inhibitor family I36 protein n=1 Tax=Kitasatospora phosalacinea TaxID=2065 RepID=UPI0035DCD760